MPSKMMARKRRSNKNKSLATVLPGFPHPYVTNKVYSKTFRFVSTNPEGKDADYVTMGSLQNLMVISSNSGANAALGFFSSVRLRKVELWGLGSTSTMINIGVDWLGPATANTMINATGTAFVPAHIVTRPPKSSLAGEWYNGQLPAYNGVPTSTPYAFALLATAGDVCEVTLDFTMFDSTSLNNPFSVTTPGGSTNGVLYYNDNLDNTSVSLGGGTKNWAITGAASALQGNVSTW